MLIHKLAISLIVLLIISYYLNKKEIIAPSFVFVTSFVFSVLWAVFFFKEWSLGDFHLRTFWVILGGCCIFVIFSQIIKIIMNIIGKKEEKSKIEPLSVDFFIKVLSIVFMLGSTFLILRSVIKAVDSSWNNVFDAIEKFDHISKFTNQSIGISNIANKSRCVSNALTYWYLYVFINNILSEKKIDFLSLLIVLLGMINFMTLGGRNYAINVIIAGIAIFFMLLYKTKGFNFKLSGKIKTILIIIPIAVLIIFPKLTNLVGRSVTTSNTYYLAIYCGAEIKNLDLFLEDYNKVTFGKRNNMTFIHLNNWLGPKLGYTEPYKFDLPFRRVNGYSLGNVYTTFYAYIYDYGYEGMILLVALMACIIQLVYEIAKRQKLTNTPNMWVLIYGFMFSSIALSFFSNKFYEQNFNIAFVYDIILWYIFNKTLLIIKLKKE